MSNIWEPKLPMAFNRLIKRDKPLLNKNISSTLLFLFNKV